MPRNSFVHKWYPDHYEKSHLHWPSLRAMQKAAGRFARKLPSKIDYHALLRMLKTLNEDDEFEQFFDALPSLCDSKRLKDARSAFVEPNKKILSHALIGMMDRTLLSELISEEVKQRRIIICTKVIEATSLLEPSWILRRVLFGEWIDFTRSIHFGRFVQTWKKISDPVTAFYAQFIVAVILATVKTRDERWFELASGQLSESKSYLRSYYANGDSILLANTIFIIRRAIQTFSGSANSKKEVIDEVSLKLELLCRFDIQNTLAEHQHMFCKFWNQLVVVAHAPPRNRNHSDLCVAMLKSIRRLYVALHGIPKGDPSTLDGDPNTPNLLEIPNIYLARGSPAYPGQIIPDGPSLYNPSIYTSCELEEHRHSELLELPLNGPPIASPVSMDKIRTLTAMLFPVLPPTIPTVASH